MADKSTLTISHRSYGRTRRFVVSIVTLLIFLGGAVAACLLMQHLLVNDSQEKLMQQHFNELEITTTPISEKERDEYTVPSDHPRYIYISSIGINKARIIASGVKVAGISGQQQLDVPKNIGDVGWYNCQINPVKEKRCAQPTLPGAGDTDAATVLTGHTCFSRTTSCVFDNISKLKHGDQVVIERGNGEKVKYTVRQVEILPLTDVDMTKAMQPIEPGTEGLTLITCAGTYRGTVDANGVPTADKRVLVYAVREGV